MWKALLCQCPLLAIPLRDEILEEYCQTYMKSDNNGGKRIDKSPATDPDGEPREGISSHTREESNNRRRCRETAPTQTQLASSAPKSFTTDFHGTTRHSLYNSTPAFGMTGQPVVPRGPLVGSCCGLWWFVRYGICVVAAYWFPGVVGGRCTTLVCIFVGAQCLPSASVESNNCICVLVCADAIDDAASFLMLQLPRWRLSRREQRRRRLFREVDGDIWEERCGPQRSASA